MRRGDTGEPDKDNNGYRLDFNKIVPMPRFSKEAVAGTSVAHGLAMVDNHEGLKLLSCPWVQRLGISNRQVANVPSRATGRQRLCEGGRSCDAGEGSDRILQLA